MIPMYDLTLRSRLTRNPNLVAVDMDGDTVMMCIETGQYFGVAGVAARVWDLLENSMSLDELVRIIQAEYEVDEATCQADLMVFVRSMAIQGVVRLC